MIYVETSLVLEALKKGEDGERALVYLRKVKEEGGYLSEVVLAEIHNLEEPRREWVARLLKELPFPLLRVNPPSVELANRYVYNRVFEGELRDLGLHVALASVRGCERLDTLDGRLDGAIEGVGRVNQVAGYPSPSINFPLGKGERDGELDGVRALSWKVTSRKKAEEVARIIQEMADSFMKEKELSLEKVGKVEIF
jgi:predicted nucleic acid-binding protein